MDAVSTLQSAEQLEHQCRVSSAERSNGPNGLPQTQLTCLKACELTNLAERDFLPAGLFVSHEGIPDQQRLHTGCGTLR
jgi:hypothetical protein